MDADELPEPVQAELAESAEVGSAEVGGAVRAEVAAVDVVRARPEGPGDIGGDAYRVRVVLHNGSDEPLDLGAVLLTVDTADGVPAAPITGDPSVDPLGGELAPGGSAEGTYLFSVPDTDSGDIEVSFSYSIKAPVAVFTGDPQSA